MTGQQYCNGFDRPDTQIARTAGDGPSMQNFAFRKNALQLWDLNTKPKK